SRLDCDVRSAPAADAGRPNARAPISAHWRGRRWLVRPGTSKGVNNRSRPYPQLSRSAELPATADQGSLQRLVATVRGGVRCSGDSWTFFPGTRCRICERCRCRLPGMAMKEERVYA